MTVKLAVNLSNKWDHLAESGKTRALCGVRTYGTKKNPIETALYPCPKCAKRQPRPLIEVLDEADDDMDAAFPEQAFIPR